MGLLPTLAFSDPHRDPYGAGRGRIPVDRSASIGLPSEFRMDHRGRPWTTLARTGNAVSTVRLPPPTAAKASRSFGIGQGDVIIVYRVAARGPACQP